MTSATLDVQEQSVTCGLVNQSSSRLISFLVIYILGIMTLWAQYLLLYSIPDVSRSYDAIQGLEYWKFMTYTCKINCHARRTLETQTRTHRHTDTQTSEDHTHYFCSTQIYLQTFLQPKQVFCSLKSSKRHFLLLARREKINTEEGLTLRNTHGYIAMNSC